MAVVVRGPKVLVIKRLIPKRTIPVPGEEHLPEDVWLTGTFWALEK